MKQPLLLLSGLLCDETIWADIPQRLGDVADVRIISFPGFSSIHTMAEHVLAAAPDKPKRGGRFRKAAAKTAPAATAETAPPRKTAAKKAAAKKKPRKKVAAKKTEVRKSAKAASGAS